MCPILCHSWSARWSILAGLIISINALNCSLSYGQNQSKVYHQESSQIERIKVISYRGTVKFTSNPNANQAVLKILERPSSGLPWTQSVRREGPQLVVEVQPPTNDKNLFSDAKKWPAIDIEISAKDVPIEVYGFAGDTLISNWRSSVRVTQQSGSVIVTGGEGEVDAHLFEGKLNVTGHKGRVTLDTYKVDVVAKDIEGDTEIENFNGKLTLTNLNGQQTLRSESGAVNLDHSQGNLDFRLERGSLVSTEFVGPVRGVSESASIQLGLAGSVDVKLRATDGKVSVALPPDLGVGVNIETKQGDLTLPATVHVKRSENDRVAVGEIPGNGHGFIFIRTDLAPVRLR